MATHVVGCVHVLGVNLPAQHWLPLAAEMAMAEQQSVAQRTAALVVLSALLFAAAARPGREVDASCLQLAAETLCSSQLADAAAAVDGTPLRQQLLAACSNLLRWTGPAAAPVVPHLFQLLLRLWSVEAAALHDAAAEQVAASSSPDGSLTAAAVLAQLAAVVGHGSAANLCAEHGRALLTRSIQGHEHWTHTHPDWRTLSALLRLSDAGALQQLLPAALPALQAIAAGHEQDPRLRLDLLQLTVALLKMTTRQPPGRRPQWACRWCVPCCCRRWCGVRAASLLRRGMRRSRLWPRCWASIACQRRS